MQMASCIVTIFKAVSFAVFAAYNLCVLCERFVHMGECSNLVCESRFTDLLLGPKDIKMAKSIHT